MAFVLMDLVAENNAFPLDPGAMQIGNEKKIVLVTITLNSPLDITEYDNYKNILLILNYIHCKAFGVGTGIRLEKSQDEMSCMMHFGMNNPSYLTFLVSAIGSDIENIILMAILTEHHDVQQGGAFGGQVEDYITIWSVAKNPGIDFPNAFGVYLEKIKEINNLSGYEIFKLQVDPSNTLRMTEQGRIRLYASLGFNIDRGTLVETIYPEGVYSFRSHEAGNIGRVYLMKVDHDYEKCDFLGNLKSYQQKPIPMSSTRATLGVYRDIYCGFKESFKGNKMMGHNAQGLFTEINPPFRVVKNSDIDISPLLQSIVPPIQSSTTTSSSTTTTTSSSSSAPGPPVISSFTVLKMSYHMSLIKKLINNNNYIDFCEIPDDFIVISLTSPGSLLRQFEPEFFDIYMLKLLPYIQDKVVFKHLLVNHRSTARLPLYNIQDHDVLLKNTTKKPSITDPDLFDRQLVRSMLNSIIIDSMGRQPIFEIAAPEGSLVPGTGKPVKKDQFDIQIYTPGMRMFNYIVNRDSEKSPYGSVPVRREQAAIDDYLLSGTFKVTKDKTNKFSIAKQIDDTPFVNRGDKKFSDYFEHIRANVPIKQGKKFVLFAFGCAPLTIQGMPLPLYELFYELSHRRSIVYTFPAGTKIDSDEFIRTAVFNKNILTEHNCSSFDPAEAERRHNVAVAMNIVGAVAGPSSSTAATTTTTSSSSSSEPSSSYSTLGAGSGPGASYRQGGGKQKKQSAKTNRASSRNMATRFRRLRTRKLRKTKALKTRKMKKGGYTF